MKRHTLENILIAFTVLLGLSVIGVGIGFLMHNEPVMIISGVGALISHIIGGQIAHRLGYNIPPGL